MTSKRLVIVQPYVPTYRVPFFEQLSAYLHARGIVCEVAADAPRGTQAKRGDSVSPDWLVRIKHRSVTVRGRQFIWGGSRAAWRSADGVIMGNRGSSVGNYQALLARLSGRIKVGIWGHIRDYVRLPHPIDSALERVQLRHADHVFAYTPGGAEYATSVGVDQEKVSVVMNTVDDAILSEAMMSLSLHDLARFRADIGVEDRAVYSFVGGLDGSKRIDFLASALDELAMLSPRVVILVGGKGPQSPLLEAAIRRGQVKMLGYVDAAMKARMLSVSQGIVMPGRIGLIAVEALIARLPIITTDWPFHAPEVEYLSEGNALHRVRGGPKEYARFLARGDFRLTDGVASRVPVGRIPTMSAMVSNFGTGVEIMMNS